MKIADRVELFPAEFTLTDLHWTAKAIAGRLRTPGWLPGALVEPTGVIDTDGKFIAVAPTPGDRLEA
ncbi:MAG: hypothetical protein Q8L13_25030 [Bradyrhizobium sp.]|uniref:hypothetical protein n=1 Tax=Bradyrhizobium sp. TaxID=376 RepID=UPI00272F82A2|nr:hypothetical protein [Bradyrhizobium sp.]MDP1869591.1 hypothetical protein [Bradyrhizobium sp.]